MLSPAVVGSLARIVGELALVLLAAEAVVRWPGRRRLGRGAALALVVSLAVAGLAIADGASTTRQLRQAHRTAVGERRGLTYCFQEDGAQSRLGFIAWLRRQLPIEATYALDFAPQPDQWCLTLSLLPRLPAFGAHRPQYLIVFGVRLPAVETMIARHDPRVRVYAPGYALVRTR